MQKEAKARLRVNGCLIRAGWRFFDCDGGPANVALEAHVKIKKKTPDDFGADFGDDFIKDAELKFLRPYQLRAVAALQDAVKKGQTSFLFEMATGTGKTLTAAAVIKLFMRTGNAKRVLFLVDRLELETQAWKAFVRLLKNDFRTVIYGGLTPFHEAEAFVENKVERDRVGGNQNRAGPRRRQDRWHNAFGIER